MRSADADRPEPLDLERDLPTTPADVAALRRARTKNRRLDFDAYLDFLAALNPADPAALHARKGPRGAPFRLPPLSDERRGGQ
jgi:hypothetical protein